MFTDGSFIIFVIVGKTDFFQIFHDYQSKEEYLNTYVWEVLTPKEIHYRAIFDTRNISDICLAQSDEKTKQKDKDDGKYIQRTPSKRDF